MNTRRFSFVSLAAAVLALTPAVPLEPPAPRKRDPEEDEETIAQLAAATGLSPDEVRALVRDAQPLPDRRDVEGWPCPRCGLGSKNPRGLRNLGDRCINCGCARPASPEAAPPPRTIPLEYRTPTWEERRAREALERARAEESRREANLSPEQRAKRARRAEREAKRVAGIERAKERQLYGDPGPYVCPDCYSVGGEPCARDCAAVLRQDERDREAERQDERERDDEDTDVQPRVDAFHAHLDVCSQCANHPFGLCAVGDRLIREAVR